MSNLVSPPSPRTAPVRSSASHGESPLNPPAWLDHVRQRVENLHYGSIQIVVHDGRVHQVESTERVRLQPSSRRGTTASSGTNNAT